MAEESSALDCMEKGEYRRPWEGRWPLCLQRSGRRTKNVKYTGLFHQREEGTIRFSHKRLRTVVVSSLVIFVLSVWPGTTPDSPPDPPSKLVFLANM